MSTIHFISIGTVNTSSTKHRCIMISNELRKIGFDADVFVSEMSYFNSPNLLNIVNNWRKINKNKPDVLVLHRTSNLLDYLMVKKLKKYVKIIYDIDDAIFHTRFPGIISFSHINRIIAESDSILAGSHYLFDYSSEINDNTCLVPTMVDTELFRPIKRNNRKTVVIGWMGDGNDYQLRYLKLLIEPLKILASKYDLKFKIVSAFSDNVRNTFKNESYAVDFGQDKWVPIEYIPELISDFDIGVMPLTDSNYEKGKCAMKALEYMSSGIPVVASAVGENCHVIIEGYNGFLARNTIEWVKNLEKLIVDNKLRKLMGKNGRKFVEENYSKKIIINKFIKNIEGLSL